MPAGAALVEGGHPHPLLFPTHMTPSHTKVTSHLTLSSTCLVILPGSVSTGMFSQRGFVPSQGLPFSLPPFFLSQSPPPAPVAPVAQCFVVRSKAGGGRGRACNAEAGTSAKGFFPQGLQARGAGQGVLLLPLSGSLPFLFQLWPLDGESPFGSSLGLATTWAFYPASSSITFVHLCSPGKKRPHSTLVARAFLLAVIPLCPFGMWTESSSFLAIYQRKQMPWVNVFSLVQFLSWLRVFLGNSFGCPGLYV